MAEGLRLKFKNEIAAEGFTLRGALRNDEPGKLDKEAVFSLLVKITFLS
jgi:hypothetical protein